MLEFLICATVTILPDYLIRHFFLGQRWGKEITFTSMWFELRWGITFCLILTVSLITLIFYYHPAAENALPFYRTTTILPETAGRVSDIYVKNNQHVEAGDPLFSIENATQTAAVDAARARVDEVEAQYSTAAADLEQAEGQVVAAEGALHQAQFDLKAVNEALAIDVTLVSKRQIERASVRVVEAQGNLDSALAGRDAVKEMLETVLPAQKASATSSLEQSQVELDKTITRAGVTGQLVQFVLQRGDIVNPMFRPAGILTPTQSRQSGHMAVQAGFSQLAAQVIHEGSIAEMTCMVKPFTIVPMVVTKVQPVIASGQVRATDQLIDVMSRAQPGTLTVVLEPLYANGMDGIIPGTACLANIYTDNHEKLGSGNLSSFDTVFYHVVDTVGVLPAAILRIKALMIPMQKLVLGGH